MRFHHAARRIFIAPALGLALATAVAACSSSSPGTTTPPSTAPPASTSASASTGGGTAATAAIKANWEAFFSAATPNSKKIQLLQNGQQFAAEIQSLSSNSLASSVSAKVDSVTMTSPTQATVKYEILLGGQPAPIGAQTGAAVYENGTWQVADSSVCSLLAFLNNGKAPSVCSSAG